MGMRTAQQHVPSRDLCGASVRVPKPLGTSSRRSTLQVTNAITRQKKEEIVQTVKSKLQDSVVVFGFRYKGLDVATIQKFRRGLPEKSSAFVCKNSLMKVASQSAQGWAVLTENLEGETTWVFVGEEALSDTVKHYFKFEKDLLEEAKKAAPKNQEVKAPTSLSYIATSGKLLTKEELKNCESMPSKKQLLASIARMAKQPATRLATSVKMVPTKLAIALKKVSELDEDKTKAVSMVVKIPV